VILYLELLDRLLGYWFSEETIKNHNLAEWYSDVVFYLKRMGRENELVHAKVLRKCWICQLSPAIFRLLQEMTLAKTAIDVDLIERADALYYLRDYYLRVLRVPAQHIPRLLPETVSLPNLSPAFIPPYRPYSDTEVNVWPNLDQEFLPEKKAMEE
jgi:hypothetical protein